MGLTGWVKGLFTRNKLKTNERSVSQGLSGIKYLLQGYVGGEVSDEEVLRVVHEEPMFYACVSLIATAVADHELYVVKDGVRIEHRLEQLFRRPNLHQTGASFLWLAQAYLLTIGKVYILILPNKDLIPVPPTGVRRDRDGYSVRLGNLEVNGLELGKNLIQLTSPDLRDPYQSGAGYGHVLSQELDILEAASSHEAAYLHNSTRPDLLINYSNMSPEGLRVIQEGWMQRHQGSHNSGLPAFSNADNMEVIPLTSSFKDLGLIDLRKYSSELVRQTFGIPPELLGDVQNSNRATIDAANFLFQTNVVQPKVRRLLEEFTIKLIPLLTSEEGLEIEADFNTPENRELQLDVMKAFPQAFSINEARRLAGAGEVEDGDLNLQGGSRLVPKKDTVKLKPRMIKRSLQMEDEDIETLLLGFGEEDE